MGYTDNECAKALGEHLSTYRRQRTGKSKVPQPIGKLCLYIGLHRVDWLELADLSARLARALDQRKNGKKNY